MAFKKCRNEGCEVLIEVRNTAEGWRPFEESGNKHNCQFSDYAKKQRGQVVEDKDDHGNEETTKSWQHMNVLGDTEAAKNQYVDHTAARPSKVKIFEDEDRMVVEEEYNKFLASPNRFAWTRAQFQLDSGTFAIALYYEETK